MANDSVSGCESVCSLPPADLSERLGMIRRDIAPLVTATRELSDGREWRFAGSAENRAKVEHLVELERQCCRGITFEVRESPDTGELILSATGDDAKALFEQISL